MELISCPQLLTVNTEVGEMVEVTGRSAALCGQKGYLENGKQGSRNKERDTKSDFNKSLKCAVKHTGCMQPHDPVIQHIVFGLSLCSPEKKREKQKNEREREREMERRKESRKSEKKIFTNVIPCGIFMF